MEISELLIENGCNVNAQDKKKQTAYSWAKRNN
jgi:ankyrin repeat protein